MSIFQDFFISFEPDRLIPAIIKLVLAVVLGGFIGHEREHSYRPAGLRTHALVCVGATLVMLVSEYAFTIYGGMVDPTRLGAQVISGIGFLGAGTIIKEGVSVKGLTTAASIWSVSCVGLALGIGYYSGAIIATVLIYCALLLMKKLMIQRASVRTVSMVTTNVEHSYVSALDEFARFEIAVYSTQISANQDPNQKGLSFLVATPEHPETLEFVINRLRSMEETVNLHLE